jgi:hypothetical protein
VTDIDWKIPAPYGISIAGDRVLEMDENEPPFRDMSHEEHVTGSCDGRKAAENLMNRMMNYCSNCCSACLCTPPLTQTTTGLQAAIRPSIPLPAPRANSLVEREHPKFGSTGPSASGPFREHHLSGTTSLGPDVHFLQTTLPPSITSASRLPDYGGSSDGRHFELHNNKDRR